MIYEHAAELAQQQPTVSSEYLAKFTQYKLEKEINKKN